MEVYNCTDFQFAVLNGRLKFPDYSSTFIVKGLFRLNHDDEVSAEEEQAYACGDQYYADDDDQVGSIKYASDFVYYKPRADVSLVGHCHAPQGKQVTSCPIEITLNQHSKRLSVFGDRFWQRSPGGYRVGDPAPFEKMELRYENCFGGVNSELNPVGKGDAETVLEDGSAIWPLPNIEDPNQLLTWPQQRPEVAGFGPLSANWAHRKQKLGTYDKKWLEEKWPWFPDDFDSGYFNSAPQTLQVKAYLRGDESLQFTNMHAENANFRTRLPGIKVRCFTRTNSADPSRGKSFQEINMKLDTLAVDMDAEQLVLVWRGWSRTDSEEMEDITDVLLFSESLEAEPKSAEECYALLKKCEADQEAEFAEEEPEILETELEGDSTENDMLDVEAIIAKSEADSRQAIVDAGYDPDNMPEPTEDELRKTAALLADFGAANEIQSLSAAQVKQRVANRESFFQEDLTGLELGGIDFSGADFREANLSGLVLKGLNFSEADLTGAVLSGADLSHANMNGACLIQADLTAAILTKANLKNANLEGAVLEACQASFANFDGANVAAVDFGNSELKGASFFAADATQASFEAANLSHVVMRRAQLDNVTFDKATAVYGDFSEAEMREIRASDSCDFSGANFSCGNLEGANFEGAQCVRTNFSYADMHDINFIKANLSDANFNCADLRQAKLSKALLENTNMEQANLYEASLEKAVLRNTNFRAANLYAAETLEAEITHATFEQANLKMSKLDRSE